MSKQEVMEMFHETFGMFDAEVSGQARRDVATDISFAEASIMAVLFADLQAMLTVLTEQFPSGRNHFALQLAALDRLESILQRVDEKAVQDMLNSLSELPV